MLPPLSPLVPRPLFPLVLLLALLLPPPPASCVNLNLKARQVIDEAQLRSSRNDVTREFVSPAGSLDEFRLVDVTPDAIVIGARDHVFQLRRTDFTRRDTIEWRTPAQVVEECHMKGRPANDCHNFVRVVARRRNGFLLVCGTHAFSPQCREYEFNAAFGDYRSRREFTGRGMTPYDPRANFTYVFSPDLNDIFVATVSDFNGNDPLILKKHVPAGEIVRTQKDDLRVLDHPEFVGSFAYREFYYVWFRERTTESSEGGQVYARVGRVCRNDRGGVNSQDRWATFLKARLNCSIPAGQPFYFNELQSVSQPVPQDDGDALVFAVFSTSRSAVLMNAVCSFRLSDVNRVFNQGRFKTSRSVPLYQTPRVTERPGRCVEDSRQGGEGSAFVLKNPLMLDLVNAAEQPVLVEGPAKPDLTQIAALGAVPSTERNQSYNVVYVGRSDGHVLKAVQLASGTSVVIEAVRVFPNTLTSIQALWPLVESRELLVVGSDRVAKVPLFHCEQQTSCSRCVALRDPHCAWNKETLVCEHSDHWDGGSYVQNVLKGASSQCPEGMLAGTDAVIGVNLASADAPATPFAHPSDEATDAWSATSIIWTLVIVVVVLFTVCGFFIGYRISKWRLLNELQTAHSSGSSSNGSDYDSFGRARLTRHDSLTTTAKLGPDLYSMGPHAKMSDAMSLVLGQHHMPVITSISNAGSGYTTPRHRLEQSMLITNGGSIGGGSAGSGSVASHAPSCTLPRDYKVKKVYL